MKADTEMNGNGQPKDRGSIVWAMVAIESLFWAWCSFTLVGYGVLGLNKLSAVLMPPTVGVGLILSAPVVAVLVVLASHLGWLRRKRAD